MTWLYIPSKFAPELGCSEKASAPHSIFTAPSTEPFATWSGKPLLPRSLSALWKRERLIRRLSGLTYSPSTAQRGADQWIASLLGSRAKTCPSQGAELGLMANDLGSSSTSSKLQTIAMRDSSFWRTSQASLLPPPPLWTKPKAKLKNERPPASWESWPTEGGMRSGSLFQRPKWAPAMAAQGGSASPGAWAHWDTPDSMPDAPNTGSNRTSQPAGLGNQAKIVTMWTTPDVCSGSRDMSKIDPARQKRADTKRTTGLPTEAAYWATPDCNTSTYSNGKMGPNLRQQAAQWPTPNAHDGRRPGADLKSTQGMNLSRDAVLWPTPASRDHRTPNSQTMEERGHGTKGEQLPNFVEHHFLLQAQPTPSGVTSSLPVVSVHGSELSATTRPAHVLGRQRLNPAFACWLMGWPSWWTNPGLTNCAKSAMESYRSKLQQHLCSLCTGV